MVFVLTDVPTKFVFFQDEWRNTAFVEVRGVPVVEPSYEVPFYVPEGATRFEGFGRLEERLC